MVSNHPDTTARRRLDRQSMELTFPGGHGPQLERWAAFADESARLRGYEAGADVEATLYVLDFRLQSLASRETYHDRWRLLVRLDHPKYPNEMGWPTFISSPLPFNPHVSPTSGVLCSGNLWSAKTTMADFTIKVMRLLNLDETLPDNDRGLNPAALTYWRTMLGSRPLSADLRYPQALRPTVSALHGPAGLFGAVSFARRTGGR